ncbi:hypothetical protein [Trichothermofontia sp.]
MSAVRRRTLEQSVKQAQLQQSIGLQAAKLTLQGATHLGKVGLSILQQVLTPQVTHPEQGVRPVPAVRAQVHSLQQTALQLAQEQQVPLTVATQVAAHIADTLYVHHDPLDADWQALEQATTLEAARVSLESFTQTLESQHQTLLVQSISLACEQAALKVGFGTLHVPTTRNGLLRLVATDEQGRALVTEISTDPEQPLTMATELIGMSDASCEEILTAFDAALVEAGLRLGPPERKFTGGICELDAARDFVRQRLTPTPTKTPTKATPKPAKSASPRPRPLPPQTQQRF